MVKIIEADNVNGAIAKAIPYLLSEGIREETRNGPCLVAPGPVVTVYKKPLERVLFSPTRDANPFFHLMESLWMLAGRNDIDFLIYFNKKFEAYNEEGIQHGAYGYRWRNWFAMDQLSILAAELRSKPETRRAVLAMWDPQGDLVSMMASCETHGTHEYGGLTGKDIPCNTHCYFDVRGGKLNMTVCNRSNDVIWGAYGANVVHFSILQEYMAAWVGAEIGEYRQFSNNFHAYTDVYNLEKLELISKEAHQTNYYDESTIPFQEGHARPESMFNTTVDEWNDDLLQFMAAPRRTKNNYRNKFFAYVATPMYAAWEDRKNKVNNGMVHIEKVQAPDWKLVATQWIGRRERKN